MGIGELILWVIVWAGCAGTVVVFGVGMVCHYRDTRGVPREEIDAELARITRDTL
jgi:hypothetical protein